ncbi:restriction endonuclease subunit S [Leeuwenhoekiella sp. MAR_2009_132]|uniref:restriction endonuclease subunit S n=1 Tax=Leeuwenhoekiella sp. MAR_2009_132 TaxID=1392489 RepID=UPI00068CDE6A|nr:restriction endonuclease subunit S [Leeuwenhoekiella sp. MAR_2009_132]
MNLDEFRIGDLTKQVRGLSYKKELALSEPESGYVPVLRANNVNESFHITYEDLIYLPEELIKEEQFLQDGDILIVASSGSINVVGRGARFTGKQRCSFGAFCKVVRPFSSHVLSGYIAHYFQSQRYRREIANLAIGANILNIKNRDIDDLMLSAPENITTQREIVTALDKAKILIDKRHRALLTFKELLDATFTLNFSGIASVDGDSESFPLGDYIDIHHGYAFKSRFFKASGENKLLTPGNFNENGGFRDLGEKQKFYEGEFPERFLLKKDDLLVVMTEQTKGLLGTPLFVPGINFLHNQRLGLVEITSKKLNKQFLFYLFRSELMKEIIHFQSTGAKVRHTSPNKIKAIQVWLPDRKKQDRFAIFANKIEAQIQIQEKSLEEMNLLFQSLLQRAFHGNLTIDPDLQLDGYLEKENFEAIAADAVLIRTLVDRFNQAKTDALSEEEEEATIDEDTKSFDFESVAAYNRAKDALYHMLKKGLVTQETSDNEDGSIKTRLTTI